MWAFLKCIHAKPVLKSNGADRHLPESAPSSRMHVKRFSA
jgi:hypothetical protein